MEVTYLPVTKISKGMYKTLFDTAPLQIGNRYTSQYQFVTYDTPTPSIYTWLKVILTDLGDPCVGSPSDIKVGYCIEIVRELNFWDVLKLTVKYDFKTLRSLIKRS